MNLSKKDFRDYLINQYKPSSFERYVGIVDDFLPDSNYVSISWRRFYYTLQYFDRYKPEKTGKILDVGSYPGSLLRLLKEVMKSDAEMYSTGLKFSDDYMNYMKELGVQCAEVDIDPPYYEIEDPPYSFTFPWSDDFFDFVFACEIIEHLVNPLHMLKEIKRVLKPDSAFLLTTDNQTDIGNVFNILMGKSINQEITMGHVYKNDLTERKHIHLYTKNELEYILNDLGFRDVRIHLYTIQHNLRKFTIIKRIKFWIRKMFYILPRYRPRLFAVCRK